MSDTANPTPRRNRDTARIEAKLARDRARLAETVQATQRRLSWGGLILDALTLSSGVAWRGAKAIGASAAKRPGPSAVVAAGLIWMAVSKPKPPAPPQQINEEKMPAKKDIATEISEIASDVDDAWKARAAQLRDEAAQTIQRIEEDAARFAKGSFARAGALRDFAAEKAEVAAEYTDAMMAHMTDGLQDLPAEAQKRLVSARKAAFAAGQSVAEKVKEKTHTAQKVAGDNPVLAGVAALAFGAAFGYLLSSFGDSDED